MSYELMHPTNVPPIPRHNCYNWKPQELYSEEMADCLDCWQTLLTRKQPKWCKAINIAGKVTPFGFRLSVNYMEDDNPSYQEFKNRTSIRLTELKQLRIPTLEYAHTESVCYVLNSKREEGLFFKWQVSYESMRDPREALKVTPDPRIQANELAKTICNPDTPPKEVYQAQLEASKLLKSDMPTAKEVGLTEEQVGNFIKGLSQMLSGERDEVDNPYEKQ